ncbi:TonB-dependent receptor domain-containing protein [Paremcibacter congregatus]|uniref:TonB-dependent receptor domain-containing protein n=1 Tax=Paremcibacter congregatus TaxID=2043170 RepID=UPI0030EB5D69|tara:strand:+ start:1069 stop:4056 length:2988 start_codon:yes stop_codon:yes gene_type:complete
MDKVKVMTIKHLLLASVCSFYVGQVAAQEAEEPKTTELEEVVVVGSQIKGAKVTGNLPVSLLNEKDMDAIAATSAAELFGSLPSNGVMNFNGTDTVSGGVNAARGDVASINLRGIGTGNTLVLLNGRRMVQHPGTQTEDSVPVTSVNLNTIPVAGIRRVEVLHDGAAAIYGTDAVAGVINTVLRDNYEGYRVNLEYGEAENTSRSKLKADFVGGWNLNDDKTNISLSLNYYKGSGVAASELPYAASADRRSYFEDTDFAGDVSFDNRSTTTPWGRFTASESVSGLTTSGGVFHIEPVDATDSNQDCVLPNGLCIDSGSISRDQRYDANASRSLLPDTERGNAFLYLNHEFDNGMEFYSELSYYRAESKKYRAESAMLSSAPITISKNAYWNPLGALGNPNRVSGFNIPDEGLDLVMTSYRVVDAGTRDIDVDNETFRTLAGLRGNFGNWDWDSAVLYSEATTLDTTHNRVSSSLLQQAINRTDETAYNPFNGGDPDNVNIKDTTLNDPAIVNSFLIDVTRFSKTTLALGDFKVSNPDVADLWAGSIGVAVGVEARRETFLDDRDDRLDGTTSYYDQISGDLVNVSDVVGSSDTPDASGQREVFSAFVEMAVPLVNEEMDIPLVQSLDLQIAGRFEHYSDVGSVFKPKFALSWYPASWVQVRGAYSEGFRAPNLEQLHTQQISRVTTVTDYYRCQAEVNKGDRDDVLSCGGNDSVANIRLGNTELKPENDKNYSLGAVFTAPMVEGLTFTVDYWRVEQKAIVGILNADGIAALDYLDRMEGGFNEFVIRDTASADDIDFYAGSGLTAVGDIVEVIGQFRNLDSRTTEGLDLGAYFDLDDTAIGDFNFKVNTSYLITAFQEISPETQRLVNAGIVVADSGTLIEMDGRPKWQASGTITWRNGNWGAGLYGKYVGAFFDTSVQQDETQAFWRVPSWSTFSLYGQYTFDKGVLDNTRIRFGVRNIFDSQPPVTDETYGYEASLHSSEGRFFYASVRKSF